MKTHGGRDLPEYGIWCTIKSRCLNPNQPSFADYGARGITICERWQGSFDAFLSDMGRRPSALYTVERRDNDGPYSPENCFWATRAEQGKNRRDNHWITFGGKTLTISQWAAETGVSHQAICGRLKAGWSLDAALFTPVKKRGKSDGV